MNGFDVLLGFDMETDIGSWTPFYEGLRQATPKILDLFGRQAITGTFYYVGAAAREVPESVLAVARAGHEIGTHSLYHETVGDPLFPIPGHQTLLPHEVKPRLALNTDWLEAISGRRPVSFRGPRLWGSTAVCNALEELGYVSDASYPLYFHLEQLAPYHPHRHDWTKAGDLRLVEIPNFADLSIVPKDPYGRDRDQWPKFRTESAEKLLTHVDNFLHHLDVHGVGRKVLCFYFHPWEFHPMPEGLIHFGEGAVQPDPFLTKNSGPYALQQFELLVEGLKRRGARFRTAAEIARAVPPGAP